ncbi:DUF3370 family protein [Microcoleus sp. AT9_B5]
MRELPGKLDSIPLFHSNSPKWVKKEGILLSTFPPDGKKVPAANLNFAFQGHFGNPTSASRKNAGALSRHRLRSPGQLRRTLQSDFAAA